jgi:hypothetical protein
MITMADIIAFIERAMKENFEIRTTYRDWSSDFKEYVINIYNSDEDLFVIQYSEESPNKKDNIIQISKGVLDWVDIEVSDMDIALFKVEVLKAQEYSKNKVIEAFNNFFDKEETRFKDINDLDNEDD